jgi:hypothetical protein
VLSQYHGYKDHPEIYMLSNLDRDGKPSCKQLLAVAIITWKA